MEVIRISDMKILPKQMHYCTWFLAGQLKRPKRPKSQSLQRIHFNVTLDAVAITLTTDSFTYIQIGLPTPIFQHRTIARKRSNVC